VTTQTWDVLLNTSVSLAVASASHTHTAGTVALTQHSDKWYLTNTSGSRFGATRRLLAPTDGSSSGYIETYTFSGEDPLTVTVSLFAVNSSGALVGTEYSANIELASNAALADRTVSVTVPSNVDVPTGGGVAVQVSTSAPEDAQGEAWYSPVESGEVIAAGTHVFTLRCSNTYGSEGTIYFGAGQSYAPKSVFTQGPLGVDSASHTHTAANVALTQKHVLAVNAASHTHAAQNVSLNYADRVTQTWDVALSTGDAPLVVNAASHTHTAETVSLTQQRVYDVSVTPKHLLEIDSASHAHSAGQANVTPGRTVLGVENALHSHGAESVGLTQHQSLTVNSASHTHTAENVTIIYYPSAPLRVDSARHSHGAEVVSLAVTHKLTLADSAHSHTADNVTLLYGGDYQLVIEPAAHLHAADSVVLSQTHRLVVNDARHLHTAGSLGVKARPAARMHGRQTASRLTGRMWRK
jgi:hypothetical protein